MLSEAKRLESEISLLKKQLEKFPPDNLICARNGNRYKWYLTDGSTRTYLPKKNRKLAEELAYKKYLSLRQKDLTGQLKAILLFLHHHPTDIGQADRLLLNHPGFQELLKSRFQPLSQELSEWMNAPYIQNPAHPEQLVHKCSSGHMVRSKSEALIAMFLHINRIPFRYECPLKLGEITIYPDFTIRHPYTGATFYYEHFGLMDNRSYSQNACNKLQLYTAYGIIPGIHLITTYETKEHPLSAETVRTTIQNYFGKH